MKFKSKSRGFTLVELLVVISIIALLTGIIMVNFTRSRATARDAQRVSDLNQIQLALEQYFDRCGEYPKTIQDNDLSIINNGCPNKSTDSGGKFSLADYISKVPTPPSNATTYDYAINDSSDPTDYVLHTTLEYGNPAQKNSLPTNPPTSWTFNGSSFNCYNETTYPYDYCIGTK